MRRFWRPSIVPEVSTFVAACTVCAQNKNLRQAPDGLLQPLPVPHLPSSHISLDIVTGLSLSDSITTILTVVDRSSIHPFFSPYQVTLSQGEGPAQGAALLPYPWTSGRYGLRSWSSVLEGILHPHLVSGQPVLWFSPLI